MSKLAKRELQKQLSELGQINEQMLGVLENEDWEQLIGLLTECQQRAIEIGNRIEALIGTGTKSVELLEKYCENLYRQAQIEQDRQDAIAGFELLEAQLKEVRELISEEISEKKEVVFFPYKASMWDSLESIWRAAVSKPELDVYVVPIPYYDKLLDGSLGEMHYEGGEYPPEVQVVDWREYAYEMRKPDVVFIHNPYDNGNRVTTVEPRFYSSVLKQHTEMLVYVPYFLCLDGISEELCSNSAVLHADKVIVQSERIQKMYKNTYIKLLGQRQREQEQQGEPHNEAFWMTLQMMAERKFLALGSPKIDKVLETKQTDCQIPKEWKDMLTVGRKDGKKVIFYNTSLAALLKNADAMLDKIEQVLEIMRESRDAILLWRPHPLYEQTLVTMRTQLLERYHKIVTEYKEANWGIFDDTPDLNRAIVLSDAYYGDNSSVAALFEAVEKPVLIQNVVL